MKKIGLILGFIGLILGSISAQTIEEHWTTDFSGGIRPDLSPAMMADKEMIRLHNAVIEGTSIKLRPGFTLWKKRLDALSDGSNPKAVDDAVYGVRSLYEFYNDVTRETQVLAVINDEVWWADTDSTNWHRIGLSAGTVTAAEDDSIVIGADTDWWPRMLPQDGDDWTLHIGDSAEGVHRVVGSKILLDGQWQPTTASGAKYELVPVFDSTKNLHFTSVNQTCFISDGTRPVVQWRRHTIDNGYYIVDSAIIDSTDINPGTNLMRVDFSSALTLALVDSANDYAIRNYSLVWCDTLKDSLQIYTIPVSSLNYSSNVKRLQLIGSPADTIPFGHMAGLTGYVCLPLNEGYFFDPDTVYSGIIDMTVDGDILIDTSESFYVSEMKSGAYYCKISDTTGEYGSDGWRDFTISSCRVVTVDTSSKTYTGLRISVERNDGIDENSLLDNVFGKPYVVLKGDFYPRAHFTQWRQARMWFMASPVYPNAAWYSKPLGFAGLITTNYYDDVSTLDFETIGAGDGDEITGLSLMQQWLIAYKRHHIYTIGGTPPKPDVYLKSSNYGLWSDGFLMPYKEINFGLNRLGMFGFNGASVEDHNQISLNVSPFFTDTLNLAEMDIVRGELYDDYILFSFPSGSNTSNNKTLAVDTKTGAWSTWSIAAASYLTRRAPGSLDTLLFGSPDSASIFVMGGTSDAGTTIEMIYKSPFFDFGTTAWKKQLRKVQITGQFNVNSSLSVFVYTDSLHDESYGDTVACSALLGYNSPQDVLFELPVEIEDATRISIEVRSIGADSLRIDKIGYFYTKTRKVGSQ